VLSQLFTAVRAAGREENDPTDPALRPALTDDAPLRLLGGTDGEGLVTAARFAGDAAARTGLHALDAVTINMLALPGRTTPDFLAVGMAYCDRNDVFFLADGVGSTDLDFEITADEVRQVVEGLPTRSNNAAMFYPWIRVPDPVGIGRNPQRLVPPSGHLAGVFARTDVTRGVWKAPAGIEASVTGALDVQHRLVDADQDLLNPIGLNCIRQFPNVGIVSWGARTLSSDPEWRYVPVRRTALFLKESLRRGLQWAVFEPNDQELWDRIRINITAFMLGLFRQHAFQGATPEEAFAVKCDRETNPQELVDQGIVTARVSFAPLKPAEFVTIELSQKSLLAV
jgi:phage tail sheath protein FI